MIRCVNGVVRTITLTAGAALVAAGASAQTQRMPSAALHDIVKGRLANMQWTPVQAESALKPILANVRTTGLSPDEEVALALGHFFTFDGLSAKPLFEKHRDRVDALGRVSWQSLQQMTFFGAKDYALVEQRTKEYRQRFQPTVDDTEYTFNMVNNLSRLAATSGNHARAVDLVLGDLQALPVDAPFRSFDLLGQRYTSFQSTGRADEALQWMRRHRDALRAAVREASSREPSAPTLTKDEALSLPHRPGVVHMTPFADLLLPDDARWTRAGAVRFQRIAALEKFDRWIAAAEQGKPIPLP